jgi:hypothetical protein
MAITLDNINEYIIRWRRERHIQGKVMQLKWNAKDWRTLIGFMRKRGFGGSYSAKQVRHMGILHIKRT